MRIDRLRSMQPAEVRAGLDRFSRDYVTDWDAWLATEPADRPMMLGKILRRWQATRPYAMRRLRSERLHDPPYLEDLLARAEDPLLEVQDLSLASIQTRTPTQQVSMFRLWRVFADLTTTGSASCVGISKAVLLLTDGHIGPALDSFVRARLGVDKPANATGWLQILDAASADLLAYEALHGPLADAAPPAYRHLASGRLYDMVFGPGAAEPA